MMSLAASLLWLALVGWIAVKRRYLFYLLLFVLFAFAWRLMSTLYIDLYGPLYAEQLYRYIGDGEAAAMLVISHLVALTAVLVVFRHGRMSGLASLPVGSPRRQVLATIVFAVFLVLVTLLFWDLFRRAIIPVFQGVEHNVYTQRFGGVFHRVLIKYGQILSFYLGLFYSRPALFEEKPDRRFLVVLLVIFAYLVLTGHRFSAFYSYSSFFLMPWGVELLRRQYQSGHDTPRRQPIATKVGVGLAVVLIGTMALIGVYRSLFFTLGYDPDSARQFLGHRIFVQQGELWVATYERVFLGREVDPRAAFAGIFTDPVVPISERNSTIPYLMRLEIGDRVYPLVGAGSNYTGGFPEIVFELFGPILAFPVIFLMAYLTASLLLMLTEAILGQRYMAVFLIFYVLYAFLLLPISGMLNFIVHWKYWVKVSAMVAWLQWERLARRPAYDLRPPKATRVMVPES